MLLTGGCVFSVDRNLHGLVSLVVLLGPAIAEVHLYHLSRGTVEFQILLDRILLGRLSRTFCCSIELRNANAIKRRGRTCRTHYTFGEGGRNGLPWHLS